MWVLMVRKGQSGTDEVALAVTDECERMGVAIAHITTVGNKVARATEVEFDCAEEYSEELCIYVRRGLKAMRFLVHTEEVGG